MGPAGGQKAKERGAEGRVGGRGGEGLGRREVEEGVGGGHGGGGGGCGGRREREFYGGFGSGDGGDCEDDAFGTMPIRLGSVALM